VCVCVCVCVFVCVHLYEGRLVLLAAYPLYPVPHTSTISKLRIAYCRQLMSGKSKVNSVGGMVRVGRVSEVSSDSRDCGTAGSLLSLSYERQATTTITRRPKEAHRSTRTIIQTQTRTQKHTDTYTYTHTHTQDLGIQIS
jgi:hypothetical protein